MSKCVNIWVLKSTIVKKWFYKVKILIKSMIFIANWSDLEAESSSANALGLEHLNQSKITILASKSASKYRLQADTLGALVLPMTELDRRLSILSKNSIQMQFDGPLPLQELWSDVESHYQLHNQLQDATVGAIISLMPLGLNQFN